MNLSNYSNTRHLITMNTFYFDPFQYKTSTGCNKMHEVNPKEFPFNVRGKDFKTRSEAEDFAKKVAGDLCNDVVISQRIALVKFPVPDLKVEELVAS